eukprot:gene22835-biopygen8252
MEVGLGIGRLFTERTIHHDGDPAGGSVLSRAEPSIIAVSKPQLDGGMHSQRFRFNNLSDRVEYNKSVGRRKGPLCPILPYVVVTSEGLKINEGTQQR